MADYHIYIHGGAGGNNGSISSKFQPSSAKEGDESSIASKFQAFQSKAQSAEAYASGSKSLGSAAVGALAKVSPWIAAIVAVIKIGTTLTDKGFSLYGDITGDLTGKYHWDRVKAMTSAIFNPIGAGINIAKGSIEYRNQVYNVENARALSGNTFTGISAGGKLV